MSERVAANRTVTAFPNEQFIQNAINWPQEVKTAFTLMKDISIYSNISQTISVKHGPCQMQHIQTFEDWLKKNKKKTTKPADRPVLVANNYPSTNLVFASMPHKNDFKNWWALFWKWPICWQWEMNSSMYSSVSHFWRWFQFWVGEFLDVWNAGTEW